MTENEFALPKLLRELGSHFDARDGWVFFAKNRKGGLTVYSNQRPEQIRALAKSYLKSKRKPDAQ